MFFSSLYLFLGDVLQHRDYGPRKGASSQAEVFGEAIVRQRSDRG